MMAVVVVSVLLLPVLVSGAAIQAPTSLLVEGLDAAVAVISEAQPRFSFVHGDTAEALPRGTTQASYQITVSRVDGGQKVWDSGDVTSSNCSQIVYSGPALAPFTRYRWTAQWTASGAAGTSAQAVSTFETGPMAVGDWHNASWLQGTQNRYELQLPTAGSTVVWARAYVAAVGCHSLEVNSQVPAPDLRGICPWPVDSLNIRYQTRDITALLRPGENGIGLLSGHVMTSNSRVMALLQVHLSDGSNVTVTTGEPGWMERPSYIVDDSAWRTTIDWTQREPGWSGAGFAAGSQWKNATVSEEPANPAIALQMPLSAVLGEVKPISVTTEPNGDFVFTFPKNFVGTVKLQALPDAEAGSEISLLLGEWLGAKPPTPLPPTPVPPPAPTTPVKCGTAPEGGTLILGGCKTGDTIDKVEFASYGTPKGDCKTGFKPSTCNDVNSTAAVSRLCLGKPTCKIVADNGQFGGGDPCLNVKKLLSASVHCSGDPPTPPTPPTPPPPPSPPPPTPTDRRYPLISGGQQQYENHILQPGNTKQLETLFCWHGFIYVRVSSTGNTGFKGTLDSIVGLEIHTNVTQTGYLEFGGTGSSKAAAAADVLNGINQMTLQSQRTNIAAYMPTDCPTREKHGWMGDALDASEEVLYNFNTLAVHENFMKLVDENQGIGGDVPFVIPAGNPGNGSCNDIAWTAAYPLITHDLFTYYGDLRVVERRWPSLVLYIENLIGHASSTPEKLAECDQFQDWLCGNSMSCCANTGNSTAPLSCPVPKEMGGFNYVLALKAMSQMAKALGKPNDMTRYAALADAARQSFHSVFYNNVAGTYGNDFGAIQSLTLPALDIGSPPAELRPHVVQTLQDDLATRTHYHLAVGAVTSKILLNVLSDNGLHKSAMRVATQTTEPSWGYWWTQNSTTCWEAFPGGGDTRNHIFLCGGVGEWFWKHLVGLTPANPGFEAIRIAPELDPDYGPGSLNATFHSVRGKIHSSWVLVDSDAHTRSVSMSVNIPLGVQSATIVVPKPFVTSPKAPTPAHQVCGSASEKMASLTLYCSSDHSSDGSVIDKVEWAAWGTPNLNGDCSEWKANSTCNSNATGANSPLQIVSTNCTGKPSCVLAFGGGGHSALGDPCPMVVKSLAVRVHCTVGKGGTISKQASSATITEAGKQIWDGKQLVGKPVGILAARDEANGVALDVTGNSKWSFVSAHA